MTQEIWRAIPNAEGYEVSDQGRVRSIDRTCFQKNRWGFEVSVRRKGKILSVSRQPNGYLRVSLGRDRAEMVHRLVASAFVEGDTALQVNHKDGVRDNNAPANLEWVTAGENIQHSYDNLDRKVHAKKAAVIVGGVTYESGLAAAKALGVSAGSVASALNRNHRLLGMEVCLA